MVRAIVIAALDAIGITEIPPGSNRSATIDQWVEAVGSPLGSYWCAAFAAACFRAGGADVPPVDAGATKAWHSWAFATNRWTSRAAPGRAVLYGDSSGVPDHIGIVIRATPLLLTVEGNTTFNPAFDRNGVGVSVKEPDANRILGYVSPVPLTGDAA